MNAGPILVAVDFSEDSAHALIWACDASLRREQNLVILHVVHDPESAPGVYDGLPPGGPIQSMEEAAEKLFRRFLQRVGARHDALNRHPRLSTRLVTGLPASRIVEIAEEIGAGHIVVGSTGRTGLRRLLLGSKAQRVAQLAHVPVTIVKRPQDHTE